MNRVRYLALVTRTLDAHEIGLARASARLIDAAHKRASDAYAKGGGITGVREALSDEAAAWNRVIVAHYAATGPVFARIATDTLGPRKRVTTRTFTERLVGYVRSIGLAKAKGLAATTMQRIQTLIAAGEVAGFSVRSIADTFASRAVSRSRARTIARTETHSAATWSMQAALEAEPDAAEITREWVAALDERVREDHADADGQTVGIDEPFIVGGVELMQPGDQTGPPEQTINCRCVVLATKPRAFNLRAE